VPDDIFPHENDFTSVWERVAVINNYFGSYARTKFRFAKRMLWHRVTRQPRVCPYCGQSSTVSLMKRKKLILDILVCDNCRLIFRWPMETEKELDIHYDMQYAVAAPQVVLPDPHDLPQLKKEKFTSLFGPDLGHKMEVLRSIRPSGRVLDYGCSWGYATCLMQQNGYRATGFEISKPRAKYAREQLGLTVVDSIESLEAFPEGSFDIVYSNHVLEHLPMIGRVLALFGRLLAPDGIAVHALPNFSGHARRTGEWLQWIGEDHPIAPDIEFFQKALPAAGLGRCAFASSPYNADAIAAVLSGQSSQVDGDELLVVAQK
jgi:2-polyprenyl-3-methyl-5-hydroxy-6-metoxy-1,4-benzoquinol methylase